MNLENSLLWEFFRHCKQNRMAAQWRKANVHNLTHIVNRFDQSLVTVGKKTYGPIELVTWGNTAKLKIGSFVSMANGVRFLLEVEHPLNRLSTYPFKARMHGEEEPLAKGDIIVEDDVWLGCDVTVLSGVRIGQGAAVATGAIVTKDVPPYTIVGGIPAKPIRKRFEDDAIDYLLTLDYDQLTDESIEAHMQELYEPIDGLNRQELEKRFSWFPKKEAT